MPKPQRQKTAQTTTTLERPEQHPEPSLLDDLLAKPLKVIQPKALRVPKVKPTPKPKKGRVILCGCGKLECPGTITVYE